MEKNHTEQKMNYNLFVYGTLQQGQSRNYILRGLRFEKATLINFRKIIPRSLGFPFIIRENNSKVEGEIYYDLQKPLIDQIDIIEGEGELYHRILVNVKIANGNEAEAFTYYPAEILIKNYL